ncbi:AcrR family transcriptional regulator [Marmoricola sp. OAE513]|uniref:TetR/AcrR family transcriptional regulator n=1 Tax=Marmoricola sp. OAE513 TaxID=2817894 RepID=UPI001AE749B0
MGRPQEIDVDVLLGHARDLWVENGMQALTIRALSARSGVSNGAIYHHFASRNHLLGEVWAREAAIFRAFQRDRIQRARDEGGPVDAVVAAALATGEYAEVEGAAVRVLLASRPDVLNEAELTAPVVEQLREHRADAAGLVAKLAVDVWGRGDVDAMILMRNCVVDIPARLFMGGRRPNDPLARYAIEHAVRGLLEAGPPGS